MENVLIANKDIKGWGVDIDTKNDPTYPIKHHVEDEHNGYSWERPKQQPVNIEVLHSNERPYITAVFGTSVPPGGISGMLRRYAFRFSEGSFGHWIPLMLADRVNVVEGIIDDLRKGHIPNIFAEKGMKAVWKYNKKALLRRVLIAAGIITTSILLTRNSKRELP